MELKLLKFSASWCGPCKMQKREFEKYPVDVKVEEIDINSDNELIKKFNIRSIPTLILINDKEEVLHKWVGFRKSETINGFINDFRNTKSA